MNNLARAKIIEEAEDIIINQRRAKEIERGRNIELRFRRRLIAGYLDIAKAIKDRIPAKFLITSIKPFQRFVIKKFKELKKIPVADLIRKKYIIGKKIGFREVKEKKRFPYIQPEMEILEKEIEFEIVFDKMDEKAIGQLENFAIWTLADMGSKIAKDINEIVEEVMIVEGLRGYEAGARIEKLVGKEFALPKAWRGSAVQYFEGIANMVCDYAREFGKLREFERYGIEIYEIIGAIDRRTCPTCEMMIGKRFETKQALQLMEDILAVDDVEGLKKVHPWLKVKEIKRRTGITAKGHTTMADSRKLAKEGMHLPPYHLRCRCEYVSYWE